MTDKPDGRANGNGRVSSASSSHNEHALALALLSVSRTKCTRSAQVYIHFGGRHPTNLPPAVPQYALHPGLLHLVEIQFSHRKANVTDGGFDLALTVTVMSCEPDPSGFYSLFFTVSDGKVTVKSGDRLSGEELVLPSNSFRMISMLGSSAKFFIFISRAANMRTSTARKLSFNHKNPV
ncbi:uncharacterized [Tachysurus ichikawai]